MLAQALALHLALLDPAAAPGVQVLPALELARPLPALVQAGEPGVEVGAPQVERAVPQRGNVLAGYGGGLVGTLASDLVFVGMVALGFSNVSFFDDRGSVEAWGVVLALSGALGFVFVTPAATVWGAQWAERRERPGLAYAAVFAVRLAGMLVAAAFPPILFVTELVAAPLVGAAVVASGRPTAEDVTPRHAVPEEPGSEVGGAGPPRSRPVCPDAALALR